MQLPLSKTLQAAIEACVSDPLFWGRLIQHPEAVVFLEQSLKSKARRDASFAGLLLASQSRPDGPGRSLADGHSGTPRFASSTVRSTNVLTAGSGSRKRQLQAHSLRPGPAARSLLEAFDDESDTEPAPAPAKCPKRQAADMEGGSLLAPLPLPVVAHLASFLPVEDTCRLAAVVSGSRAVLELPQAWTPLVVGGGQCLGLLRRLRHIDPMGVMQPQAYPVARGLSQVTDLSLELMDPDDAAVMERATSGTSSGSRCRALRAGESLVLDPLEEFCRRLRKGWLPALERLEVTNIESHRMDMAFLELRGTAFDSYPLLRLQHKAGRYQLSCCRSRVTRWPLPARTPSAANAARVPRESFFLLQAASELTDAESLFFEEHRDVFKSGSNFHLVHAPWRAFTAAQVEQRYRAVLARSGAGSEGR